MAEPEQTTDKSEKKTLVQRKQEDQERRSFEILINPPDKFQNGDVIGYTPYFTTQFGLPHRPVKGNEWIRKNGHQTLRVTSTAGQGIPSGSIPRILISWIATWQVRHPKETVIELGKNVSQFLENELGIPRTGRYISDVKREIKRLFTADVSITTEDTRRGIFDSTGSRVADRLVLWTNPQNGDQDALFDSYIILTPQFRESLLANPVPVDLRAFPILRSSSLAIDYYVWLTRVMFSLKQSRPVTWRQLHDQFGAQYNVKDRRGLSHFRAESEHQIKTRVLKAYPNLRLTIMSDGKGIMLHPSPTPVPFQPKKTLFPIR